MKNVFVILVFISLSTALMAQAPEKMSYQAVIRNSDSQLVTNQIIGVQISILQGAFNGPAFYTETHNPITNANGLVSLEIGGGNVVSGTFSEIDWTDGPFYIKTETDISGGTVYSIVGVSQMLSVPYALYAEVAETISGTLEEIDPIYNSSIASGITGTDTTNWNNKIDSYTESQNLSDVISQNNSANNYKIINLSNPEYEQDAATKSYVDSHETIEIDPIFSTSLASSITGADTSYWNNKIDGYTESQNLNDILTLNNSAGNNKITNLSDPENEKDAVTKSYVDVLEQRIFDLEVVTGIATVTDIDNNTYNVIKIGNQYWLKENLKTTKYNNGVEIPNISDNNLWSTSTTPAFCWYNNDSINYAQTYGALYNWYTVETENLCPIGWHVPTDLEWTSLTNFIGGLNNGGKLKEAGTSHWQSPNTEANNETDFTALPAGKRRDAGTYHDNTTATYWWTQSTNGSYYCWSRRIFFDYGFIASTEYSKIYGMSIRCIKD